MKEDIVLGLDHGTFGTLHHRSKARFQMVYTIILSFSVLHVSKTAHCCDGSVQKFNREVLPRIHCCQPWGYTVLMPDPEGSPKSCAPNLHMLGMGSKAALGGVQGATMWEKRIDSSHC